MLLKSLANTLYNLFVVNSLNRNFICQTNFGGLEKGSILGPRSSDRASDLNQMTW